jgi:hypothetical protein
MLPAAPKDFLKHVPVSWDDTKLIDGYPGDKIIIARRKGKQWYIGGLNGQDQTQTIIVKFDFPDKGNYNFRLIKDGKDKKSFSSEMIKIKKGDTLKIECLPMGGFVGVMEVQK